LKEEDEADVNVTWEDQEKINRFSLENTKMQDLESKLEDLQVFFSAYVREKRGIWKTL
jgi:hypothetical protein